MKVSVFWKNVALLGNTKESKQALETRFESQQDALRKQ